ncbi:MAG: YafY family protein [Prolixibacteraceae bacterium]
MMNRIERLNAIMIHLQSKRVVKASELADRFGISLRTVYRDVRALEKAGVPIGAEAGTGYFLTDNFHLNPVRFTLQEASALLMGEKLMDSMSDMETCDHYRSAVFKIRAILKQTEKDYLESLSESISVRHWAAASPSYGNLFLSEIQQAIARRQVVELVYNAKYTNELTTRKVEPIGLWNYDARWHLIAWCRLRQGYRDFRLDRVESLLLSDETFTDKKHISMSEYFSQYSFLSGDVNIMLLIRPEQFNLLEEGKSWYGLREEKALPGGTLQLSFANNDLEGFARWLVSAGANVDIVFPGELKEILVERVKKLSAYLR